MSFKNGFVLGALVGGVVGVLFAPRPGRQSRERFKVFQSEFPARAEDLIATVSEASKDIRTVVDGFLSEKKHEVKSAIDEGKAAAKQAESDLHKEYAGRTSGTAQPSVAQRPVPPVSTGERLPNTSVPPPPKPFTAGPTTHLDKNGDGNSSAN